MATRAPVDPAYSGITATGYLYTDFSAMRVYKLLSPFHKLDCTIEACTSQFQRNLGYTLGRRALPRRRRWFVASMTREAAVHSFTLRLPRFRQLVQHRSNVLWKCRRTPRRGLPWASHQRLLHVSSTSIVLFASLVPRGSAVFCFLRP